MTEGVNHSLFGIESNPNNNVRLLLYHMGCGWLEALQMLG
jgi:hypothetical protein